MDQTGSQSLEPGCFAAACQISQKLEHIHGSGYSSEVICERAELVQEAWQDGQQMKELHPHGEVSCSEHAADRKAVQLLGLQPKLHVQETHSRDIIPDTPCRCESVSMAQVSHISLAHTWMWLFLPLPA